jgi:hypothetical protein
LKIEELPGANPEQRKCYLAFFLSRIVIGTNYLSAFTSEYVNAPADTNNEIINPTKIISI